MKKIISLITVALLLQSCYKDKGNYTYSDINEIIIKGLPSLYESYNGMATITPILLNAKDTTLRIDTNLFTYRWACLNLGDAHGQTIATTWNLDNVVLSMPSGTNNISYQVTDRSSGKMVTQNFLMNVTNPFGRGILIMTELQGRKVGLDMLSWMGNQAQDTFKFTLFPDVLNIAGSALAEQNLTGPIQLAKYSDGMAVLNERETNAYWLITESGSRRVGGNFNWVPEWDERSAFMTPSVYPQGLAIEKIAFSRYAISNPCLMKGSDRGLYYNGNNTSNMYMLSPINTVDGGVTFFSFSQFAMSNKAAGIVFDDDTKSFYRVRLSTSKCEPITASTTSSGTNAFGTLPSWNNLNMDIKFFCMNPMNIVGTMYAHAILKDGSGDYYFFRMNVTGSTANTVAVNRWQKMAIEDMPNFEQAEQMTAGGHENDYIYYSVGSKVYSYDIIYNRASEVLDIASTHPGHTITYLNFAYFSVGYPDDQNQKIICVGSFDGTNSVLEEYEITRGAMRDSRCTPIPTADKYTNGRFPARLWM